MELCGINQLSCKALRSFVPWRLCGYFFSPLRRKDGKLRKEKAHLISVGAVASTGIEPVSGASETLILSIVLRGRGKICYIFAHHLISPAALVVKIFTAMASKTTPKNLRTAIKPAGPSMRSMNFKDFNTSSTISRLARIASSTTVWW